MNNDKIVDISRVIIKYITDEKKCRVASSLQPFPYPLPCNITSMKQMTIMMQIIILWLKKNKLFIYSISSGHMDFKEAVSLQITTPGPCPA